MLTISILVTLGTGNIHCDKFYNKRCPNGVKTLPHQHGSRISIKLWSNKEFLKDWNFTSRNIEIIHVVVFCVFLMMNKLQMLGVFSTNHDENSSTQVGFSTNFWFIASNSLLIFIMIWSKLFYCHYQKAKKRKEEKAGGEPETPWSIIWCSTPRPILLLKKTRRKKRRHLETEICMFDEFTSNHDEKTTFDEQINKFNLWIK